MGLGVGSAAFLQNAYTDTKFKTFMMYTVDSDFKDKVNFQ